MLLFMPFNSFEIDEISRMSSYSLTLFNNELADFQNEVVQFIFNHKIFRQHAIMRNNAYRFEYFKKYRKDKDMLIESYQLYIDSFKDILLMPVDRNILEEQIGCHFLSQPDTFFELLSMSILKGDVYDR